MHIPEEMKKRLLQQVEENLKEVEDCPMTYGSLEDMLIASTDRLSRMYSEVGHSVSVLKRGFNPKEPFSKQRKRESRC